MSYSFYSLRTKRFEALELKAKLKKVTKRKQRHRENLEDQEEILDTEESSTNYSDEDLVDDDLTAFIVTSLLSNSKIPYYIATLLVVALIPKSSLNSN